MSDILTSDRTNPVPQLPSGPEFVRPRWGRAGAIYDLIVTVGFATPFTAALMLDLTRRAHEWFDVPGAPTPELGPLALMLTSLFGTGVTMWAVARILRPEPRFIAIDTVGRALFSSWMVWALLNGQSATIVVFLIGEITWLVLQLSGLLRLRRH